MDGGKENRHGKVHAKELRHKKKYQDPAPVVRKTIAPQPQPLEHLQDVLPGAIRISSGDNFKELASQTATGGGLVLKSERDWNKDITLGGSDKFTHYFDLDVQQLAEAITSIPFHERFNLEDVQLTNEIKERFRQVAGCTATTDSSDTPQPSTVTAGHVEPRQVEEKIETPPQLPLKLEDSSPVEEIVAQIDPKEDIQGWLDNVLDL